MAAAEVEEVEGLLDRINRICRIELEKALDVSSDDGWAAIAEVGTNPIGFGRAGGDKNLCAAEAKALDRADKPLLPTMIPAADGVVAAFWHPVDVLTPEGGPPKARHP